MVTTKKKVIRGVPPKFGTAMDKQLSVGLPVDYWTGLFTLQQRIFIAEKRESPPKIAELARVAIKEYLERNLPVGGGKDSKPTTRTSH